MCISPVGVGTVISRSAIVSVCVFMAGTSDSGIGVRNVNFCGMLNLVWVLLMLMVRQELLLWRCGSLFGWIMWIMWMACLYCLFGGSTYRV